LANTSRGTDLLPPIVTTDYRTRQSKIVRLAHRNFRIENESILSPNGRSRGGTLMKARKKKLKSLLPRRTWKINPLTKVKPSSKVYSRKKDAIKKDDLE